MNKLSEARKIGKWFFSNPFTNLKKLYSYALNLSSDISFKKLVYENIDYIDLITFEDFCKIYKIKVKKEDIVIKHPTNLLEIHPITGPHLLNMFHIELYVLCMLAKGINAKKIFEIGTFRGETISNISYNISNDAEIYVLDNRDEFGEYIKEDKRVSSMTKMFSSNSLTFDFSQFFNKIDMMFVDGGTSYKCVLSDSENAVKCVKDGGFIVWHDFFGINKAYLGLTTAVFEIARRHNLKIHLIDGTRLVIAQNNKKGVKRGGK